jgi:hypothetical protein
MLYVQFDAAPEAQRHAGGGCILKVRRLANVFDGLDLRGAEPAILLLRLATALVLGRRALRTAIWESRGLDVERGFALALGRRRDDGRWPLAASAAAHDPTSLRGWLLERGVASREREGGRVVAGEQVLAARADEALQAGFHTTPASDDPYLQLSAELGHARRLGDLWVAATRRGMRFQVEMVLRLPGLQPLHMIARDPPPEVQPLAPRLLSLRPRTAPALDPGTIAPPDWSEPGPCDCEIPADECTMKRFRLIPPDGAPPSELPGADSLRQLTAALLDLHRVRASEVTGIVPGDRVLVARSAESLAALVPGDAVLDARGTARPFAPGNTGVLGPILHVLPWPIRLSAHPFRKTFSW